MLLPLGLPLRGGGLIGAPRVVLRWLRLVNGRGKESNRFWKMPAAAVGDSGWPVKFPFGKPSESLEDPRVKSMSTIMVDAEDGSTRFSGLPLSFSRSRFHHSAKGVFEASVKAGSVETMDLPHKQEMLEV